MSIPVVVSAEHNLLSDKERDLRHVIVKAVASGLTHEERKMYVLLNSFELSIRASHSQRSQTPRCKLSIC